MRVRWRRHWGAIVAAAVALLGILGCGPSAPLGDVAALGEVAPRFSLTDVDGGTFSLQEAVATKPLVLVFLPGCT